MSEITRLIQTEGSSLGSILKEGAYMLACAFGSLATSIFVGFFASRLSANFSKTLRKEIFVKVEKFSMAEVKNFSTSSLITRTTNDVTQIEMIIAMGLQMLCKAPIMAVWAVLKIVNKSLEWSILTAVLVGVLLLTIGILMIIVLPRFEQIQKLIDKKHISI